MQNLGYTPKSGAGSVTYGALKRFGLLREADRGVRLSPLGLEIVKGEKEGQRDYAALRAAALTPTVHATIWEKYGAALPGDVTLQFELAEMGFTQKGSGDFLAQWKRTIEFARLADLTDTVSDDDGETIDRHDGTPQSVGIPAEMTAPAPAAPPLAAPGPQKGTLSVPVLGGGWATLHAPIPMTEKAWDHLIAVLQLLKPSATETPTPTSEPPPQAESESD